MNSVVTALRVVELVSASQPIGVTEVAKALELPKTSAHRMLRTLEAAGWLRQDAHGAWSLTLRAAAVGHRVLLAPTVRAALHPVMRDLSVATTETVRLWLVEGDRFLVADEVNSLHAVQPVVVDLGTDVPMHATAVGKAVLASLPPSELDEYLAVPLARLTDRTIVDPDALREQLREVRRRGWATAWSESSTDVGGVATTLPLPGGQLAVLAVTFPVHRLSPELVMRFGAAVMDAAARARALLGI